jgi:hypothetical protein
MRDSTKDVLRFQKIRYERPVAAVVREDPGLGAGIRTTFLLMRRMGSFKIP